MLCTWFGGLYRYKVFLLKTLFTIWQAAALSHNLHIINKEFSTPVFFPYKNWTHNSAFLIVRIVRFIPVCSVRGLGACIGIKYFC